MNLLKQFSNRMLIHNTALLVIGLVWVYFNYIVVNGAINYTIPLVEGSILAVCFVAFNAITVWLFKASFIRQRNITSMVAEHLGLPFEPIIQQESRWANTINKM